MGDAPSPVAAPAHAATGTRVASMNGHKALIAPTPLAGKISPRYHRISTGALQSALRVEDFRWRCSCNDQREHHRTGRGFAEKAAPAGSGYEKRIQFSADSESV